MQREVSLEVKGRLQAYVHNFREDQRIVAEERQKMDEAFLAQTLQGKLEAGQGRVAAEQNLATEKVESGDCA